MNAGGLVLIETLVQDSLCARLLVSLWVVVLFAKSADDVSVVVTVGVAVGNLEESFAFALNFGVVEEGLAGETNIFFRFRVLIAVGDLFVLETSLRGGVQIIALFALQANVFAGVIVAVVELALHTTSIRVQPIADFTPDTDGH